MSSSRYAESARRGRRRRPRRRNPAGPVVAAVLTVGLLTGGSWYLLGEQRNAHASDTGDRPSAGSPATELVNGDVTGEVAPPQTTRSSVSAPSRTSPSSAPPGTRKPGSGPGQTAGDPEAPSASTRPGTTPGTNAGRRTSAPEPVRTAGAGHTATPAESRSVPPAAKSVQQQVLELTNAERLKAGCGPLRTHAALTRAAEGHAVDMVLRHYFAHLGLDGLDPFERMRAAGFTGGSMAENLAVGYGSAQAVVAGWMDSPGHRRNLLNCDYTLIGIGYDARRVTPDREPGSWVQNFGD